jgi:hypothetical protein
MIRDFKIIKEDGVEWISQPIHFNPTIMSEYYVGEHFIGVKIDEELKSGKLSDRAEKADVRGFMPKLVEELKWVIGEGKYKYDGYALGENEISFYFLIKKSEYNQIMNKIKYWAITKDFDAIISYDVKKVQYALAR